MITQELPILKTMLHSYNYRLVLLLQEHDSLTSEQMRTMTGMSKKQSYCALSELHKAHIIKRASCHYMLTPMAVDILSHIREIERIESKKLFYKLKETLNADREMTPEEKRDVLSQLGHLPPPVASVPPVPPTTKVENDKSMEMKAKS